MKIAISIILVILAVLACGCTSQAPAAVPVTTPAEVTPAATPVLTGIWTGTTVGHSNVEGFREHATPLFNITEQKGQAFTGTKEYTRTDGKVYTEQFSGVITGNNEISIADHSMGITIGKLTSPDSVELRYLEDGPDAKAYIIRLNRQKI